MIPDPSLAAADLAPAIHTLFAISAAKIRALERDWPVSGGAPVYTIAGQYAGRGWTEWTQGFQFGSAALQFDATGESEFLDLARRGAAARMAPHVTDTGVHDHAFQNVSAYGNLLRLMNEGRLAEDAGERRFLELALKCSGAVQAARWTRIAGGGGFIYSFNGPHSLFVDSIRTLRALAAAHLLGHVLLGESGARISLLERLVAHAQAIARYSVYYGEGRDIYDVRGRVAHESVFNPADGSYRGPATQQGYSPFSAWTRGLAWAMCGFAELLEFLNALPAEELAACGGRESVSAWMRRAAEAVCDFYIENTASDGVPYWDTGAPGLEKLGDWRARPADPYNDWEPVDSSAAAIAAQGLLRLGRTLGQPRYWQAGLTVCRTLFAEPYLCADPAHHGLILHAVYHRPNGWDAVPPGRRIPCGEACLWGDYHAREAALYALRLIDRRPYLTFWSNASDHRRSE